MRVGTRSADILSDKASKDHPHACGDKQRSSARPYRQGGSSPCVWGQEEILFGQQFGQRIIPMRVGTRRYRANPVRLAEDHPHACGDKNYTFLSIARHSGSSPCVWGQVETVLNDSWDKRIIPMRVGTSR